MQREHGLDFLRVFAFAILILYHSGMGFVSWGWHVMNPETSPVLEHIMVFFNRWRIPLLFFISGCGTAFSLRRRSLGQFARERLRRLLIPLLVAVFVIVPPQIYFERLWQGRVFAGYGEFYRSVFDFVPYSKGSLSWHHMWFVAYLMVYALASTPVFAWFRKAAGQRAIAALAAFLDRHLLAFYLMNVPSLLVGAVLGPLFPVTHALYGDWANLTGSWITFMWGFVFASSPLLLDIVERRRREFLAGGIVVAALFYAVRLSGTQAGAWASLLNGYFGFFWIFTLVGYARAHIRAGHTLLTRANEAVYPFYIIHQTITVAVVYGMLPLGWSLWAKFAAAVVATFAGSWLFYEAVRRTPLTRLLFGMK